MVVLGPSHHVYMPGCAVSTAATLRTPVGDLTTDDVAVAELRATGLFSAFDPAADEAEHSIEMHLPYVAHVFGGRRATIRVTCVVVGSLSTDAEATYGAALAPLLLGSPRTLTVVSSDFCHWGRRFRYTRLGDPPPPAGMARHAAIEAMDREGMALIERQDVAGWAAYLKRTGNTICGRHPIGVLLRAVEAWQGGGGGRRGGRARGGRHDQWGGACCGCAAGGTAHPLFEICTELPGGHDLGLVRVVCVGCHHARRRWRT